MKTFLMILFMVTSIFAQSPKIQIVPLGWGMCLIPGMMGCSNWKPSPFDPQLILMPPHGKNTVAIHYTVVAIDVTGKERLFSGDSPANARWPTNSDNSVVIYCGQLDSAVIVVTEIQGAGADGGTPPPIVYQEKVF